MEGIEWSGVPKRFERQMAVDGLVNIKNKQWEVDKEPQFSRTKETTATLGDVGAQTIEWHLAQERGEHSRPRCTFH